MNKCAALLLLGSFLCFAANGYSKSYKLDKEHTEIGFVVKHLMISKVRGRFNDFDGEFSFDEKKNVLSVAKANIKTNSIDTNDKNRDKHLRSEDFFAVDEKKATAVGNSIVFELLSPAQFKDGKAKASGNLTIKGVTKKIDVDLEFGGLAKDPWDNEKAAFSIKGKINRKDFGLTWNKAVEAGGVMVGEDVEIVIEAQGTAQ